MDQEYTEDARAPKSLIERAPPDIKINWRGGVEDRWSIRLECTINTSDEADAVQRIVQALSDASAPSMTAPQSAQGEG